MRLPQAWLHSGLLLLTLMLVAVCGTQTEKNQSAEAQSRTPIQETQGDTEVGEQQRQNSGNTFNNENSEMNLCNKWMSYYYDIYTKYSKSLQKELPSCPCNFLIDSEYAGSNPKLVGWLDHRQNRNFYWRDTPKLQLDKNIYHPSDGQCMRSLRKDFNSTSSQLCCYDNRGRLITRGKRAGFPHLISPEYSYSLHMIVDYAPWNICKGNWSIFHTLLPPNNDLSCPHVPPRADMKPSCWSYQQTNMGTWRRLMCWGISWFNLHNPS